MNLLTMTVGAIMLFIIIEQALASPFATEVMRFDPAPGQFVNDEQFNDPNRALGAPIGGGINAGGNTSIVSLGMFGGSITLGFDHTVMDDLLNPLGMDAIVFGNAFWPGSNPSDHWAEPATIEISLDENQNGLADDPWYLIPGSHIPSPAEQWLAMTWDDDISDETYPPPFEHWIPSGFSNTWTTSAYELPAELFSESITRNPSDDPFVEGIFGYAEYTPTLFLGDMNADNTIDLPEMLPEDFYTVPDDPFYVGMSPGSGGGDAFDIAWAVHPITGMPANLTGFDFIRLTTAVYVDIDLVGPIGEKSAEIDAVTDVKPDPFGDYDDDGDIDLLDVAELQICFGLENPIEMGCDRFDREPDQIISITDASKMFERITGPR